MPKFTLQEVKEAIYKDYDSLWRVAAEKAHASPSDRLNQQTRAGFLQATEKYLEEKGYTFVDFSSFFRGLGGRLSMAAVDHEAKVRVNPAMDRFNSVAYDAQEIKGLVKDAVREGKHLFEIVGATEEHINDSSKLTRYLKLLLAREHPDRKGPDYNEKLCQAATALLTLIRNDQLEPYKAALAREGINIMPAVPASAAQVVPPPPPAASSRASEKLYDMRNAVQLTREEMVALMKQAKKEVQAERAKSSEPGDKPSDSFKPFK